MQQKVELKSWQLVACILVVGLISGLVSSADLSFADNNPATSNIGQTMVVPYEGYLMLDSSPLTGTQEMRFSLFESSTGGNAEWIETQTVQMYNGRFSVGLGTGTKDATITQDFNNVILDGQQLYLGISVYDANAQTWVDLSGRQAIEPVPYSAWSANSADFKTNGNLTVSGNADIGGAARITGNAVVGGSVLVTGNVKANKGSFGTTDSKATLHVEENPALGKDSVLKAGQLTTDSESGLGLSNIFAGAYAQGGKARYNSTRGASRIRFNDGTMSFWVGGATGVTDGEVTWTEALNLDTNADVTVSNDLVVNGSTSMAAVTTSGPINATGNIATSNNLNVTKQATIGTDLTVTGDASIGGKADITGNVVIDGDLTVNGTWKWNKTTTQELSIVGNEEKTTALASTSTSFCFLSYVSFDDRAQNPGGARCEVYQSSGTWRLRAKSGDNVDVVCKAYCIN